MDRPLAQAVFGLAVAFVATAALPAQLRHPCLGMVVDADGKPLAKASVTLVWTPGSGRRLGH